jgi:hypothetical protein
MSLRVSEDILSDEIKISTATLFFSVVDDLRSLIQEGGLVQVGGVPKIESIDSQTELTEIKMMFETVPGKTPYYLSFHGGGVFRKGNLEEDIRKALKP